MDALQSLSIDTHVPIDYAISPSPYARSEARRHGLPCTTSTCEGGALIAGALGLDLFEQHSEGSLPHVPGSSGCNWSAPDSTCTEVAVVKAYDAHVSRHAATNPPI